MCNKNNKPTTTACPHGELKYQNVVLHENGKPTGHVIPVALPEHWHKLATHEHNAGRVEYWVLRCEECGVDVTIIAHEWLTQEDGKADVDGFIWVYNAS